MTTQDSATNPFEYWREMFQKSTEAWALAATGAPGSGVWPPFFGAAPGGAAAGFNFPGFGQMPGWLFRACPKGLLIPESPPCAPAMMAQSRDVDPD